ncbi:MAG: SDR family oxidoreductase [Planctomycetota bacterium]
MRRIAGMSILITGASSGIGAALAQELARRGARLALVARRVERLRDVDASCGGGHLVLPGDLSDAPFAEACVRTAHAKLGRLDAVVLNAGRGLTRMVAETTDAEWREILATNLLSTAAGVRAAVPLLRGQDKRDGWRGQIVIVSSVLARRAAADVGAYSATKAAQLSLAEALRVELADDAIAVTSVHPVRTTTEFFATSAALSNRPHHVDSRLPTQTAEVVATKIATAIARPRPEVWPHWLSRWQVSFATLWPSYADRILKKYRR